LGILHPSIPLPGINLAFLHRKQIFLSGTQCGAGIGSHQNEFTGMRLENDDPKIKRNAFHG
jgi:hypothetical protein